VFFIGFKDVLLTKKGISSKKSFSWNKCMFFALLLSFLKPWSNKKESQDTVSVLKIPKMGFKTPVMVLRLVKKVSGPQNEPQDTGCLVKRLPPPLLPPGGAGLANLGRLRLLTGCSSLTRKSTVISSGESTSTCNRLYANLYKGFIFKA